MRILVANWQDRLNPRSGGAEIHLHEVFGRLAGRGHEVTLLVSGFAGAPPRVTIDGMNVHRTGGRYSYNVYAPGYYRKHLRNPGFDVFVEDLNKVPLFAPYWVKEPIALLGAVTDRRLPPIDLGLARSASGAFLPSHMRRRRAATDPG